ncbi:DMT family transporter [Paracoccus ravus]|uniref:DMT family transporter n=1 Tax=Paracoccus ravus TaxID=2447760 RepID=UPI00106ECB57|nr:DMT family transporter [Paracoccus ravus]
MWILVTLVAAAAQTARNAAQRGLSVEIGTMGATAIRFIFGLPFALLFLLVWGLWHPLPLPGGQALGWILLGAISQIAATALMLATMKSRGFGVTTALIKTEPVTLAISGAILLAEPLGPGRMLAIATATLGVLLMSGADWRRGGIRAALFGILAGGLFGLSALGFRAGLLALPQGNFVTRSATGLVTSLAIQTVLMLAWLGIADRPALRGILRHLGGSFRAGFLGAFASLFWFFGFTLTSAANVRTLALIEVPMAQLVSGRVFREGVTPRQMAGMALIVAGVGLLIWVSA